MVLNQLNNIDKSLDWIHVSSLKKEVILRITKFCNQGCLFCFTEIDNKTSFSFEVLKIEIDNIILDNAWDNLDFVITWWEPTLNKDLFKVMDYIFNKWYHITLQSNAVNFSEDFIWKLYKYSSNISFFISFHSHIPKIYDSITSTNSQFELAFEWIRRLVNSFDDITLNIVCNKFNKWTLKWYFNFIWKNFYSISSKLKINLSVMSNVYKYNNIDKILVKYDDLVNEINSCLTIIKFYNINIGSDFWWPCDLPFCLGKKLFYYRKTNYSLRSESDRYIDREKVEECKECKYKNNCSWILKLYIDKYGDAEFKTIK